MRHPRKIHLGLFNSQLFPPSTASLKAPITCYSWPFYCTLHPSSLARGPHAPPRRSTAPLKLLSFGYVTIFVVVFCLLVLLCCNEVQSPRISMCFSYCGDFFLPEFVSPLARIHSLQCSSSFSSCLPIAIVEDIKQAYFLACYKNRILRSISWLLAQDTEDRAIFFGLFPSSQFYFSQVLYFCLILLGSLHLLDFSSS